MLLYVTSRSIQISDFGLAKWLPELCTHHIVSTFEGTFGFVDLNLVNFSMSKEDFFAAIMVFNIISYYNSYLPPEYFLHGIVDEKTDVYAYGVLLLEIITGRPALDSAQKSLVMWVSCFCFPVWLVW